MTRPRNLWVTLTRRIPLLIGVACALAVWVFAHYGMPISSDWVKKMLSPMAGLAGVFVGFAGTAKSVLLALSSGSKVIANLKKLGYYKDLVGFFFDTAIFGLISAVLSIVGLAFDWKEDPTFVRLGFTGVWCGATAATLVSVYFSASYLSKLLSLTADEHGR